LVVILFLIFFHKTPLSEKEPWRRFFFTFKKLKKCSEITRSIFSLVKGEKRTRSVRNV